MVSQLIVDDLVRKQFSVSTRYSLLYFNIQMAVKNEDFNQRFKNVEYLNHGGFGVVASADCNGNNEKRAIKLLDDDGTDCGEKDSKREMDVLTGCKHGNIVQYFRSWSLETESINPEWHIVLKSKYLRERPLSMTAIELELCKGTSSYQ